MNIMESIVPALFLILIPIAGAVLLALFYLKTIRKISKRREKSKFVAYIFEYLFLNFAFLIGSFSGLAVSTFLNRRIFQFEIFDRLLPNDIVVWYGFGPGFTPQFLTYWRWVFYFWLFACPVLFLVNLKNKRTQSPQKVF